MPGVLGEGKGSVRFYLNPIARREWSAAGRAAIAARYGGMAWVAPEWPMTIRQAVMDDLSPWRSTRFHTGEVGEHEHDAPALAAAITLLGVPESALVLRDTMSDISELAICAGWEGGLEESLWRYIERDDAPHPYAGYMDHDDDDRALLRRLRDESGVWWVYDEKGNRAVSVEEFRAAMESRGEWSDSTRVPATVANILDDGWCRGLHTYDTGSTCPCAECHRQRDDAP